MIDPTLRPGIAVVFQDCTFVRSPDDVIELVVSFDCNVADWAPFSHHPEQATNTKKE